jgi:hypothetical protein
MIGQIKEKQNHHRLGTVWQPEIKAKISASSIVDKDEYPDLWERLYNATLERMLVLEEINGKLVR